MFARALCLVFLCACVVGQATIEESCFRLVTEADAQATAAAGGGGGAQEGQGNAPRRRDRERLCASRSVTVAGSKILAGQVFMKKKTPKIRAKVKA